MKKPGHYVWKVIHFYGIGTNDSKIWRTYLSEMLTIYLLLQSIVAMIVNRKDKDLFYQALEDIIFNEFSLLVFTEFLLYPEHIRTAVTIIDGDFFDYTSNTTKRKESLMKEGVQTVKNQMRVFARINFLFYTALFCLPIIGTIIEIIYNGGSDAEIQYQYRFASDCWYPFEIDNFLIYFLLYLPGLIFYFVIYTSGTSYVISGIGLCNRIWIDMKILRAAIEEVHEIIFQNSSERESDSFLHMTVEQDGRIKCYLKQIIDHHNMIYHYLKNASRVLFGLSYNCYKSAMLIACVSLVRFFEFDEVREKIKNIANVCMVFSLVFIYSRAGQHIEDEGENIRLALYNSPWIYFPNKYKKYILIMLNRTERKMQMKPKGLITWNFDNFASTVNGAYAYCNFLRTTNK